MWVNPFGGYVDSGRCDGVPDLETDTFGIAIGGDMQVSERLTLGAGLAWSETDIDGKTLAATASMWEGYQLAVYGSYEFNETAFVEAYAIVGVNDNETRRDISIGALNRVARADYNSVFTRVYSGFGSEYRVNDQLTFSPKVSLRCTYIDADHPMVKQHPAVYWPNPWPDEPSGFKQAVLEPH